MLGIPTVTDRIVQMVVKIYFEPMVEPYFCQDSYGYKPEKSALDAIAITRQRCWKYDWVLEYDIKALFDTIDHELLMRAVKKHTDCGSENVDLNFIQIRRRLFTAKTINVQEIIRK